MNGLILDRQHRRCRNRPSATAARLWDLALSPDVMNGAESAPASKFTSNFALSTATLSLALSSRPPLPLESLSTICTRSLRQRISVRSSTLLGLPFFVRVPTASAQILLFQYLCRFAVQGWTVHSLTLGILFVSGFCHSSGPGAPDYDITKNFQF